MDLFKKESWGDWLGTIGLIFMVVLMFSILGVFWAAIIAVPMSLAYAFYTAVLLRPDLVLTGTFALIGLVLILKTIRAIVGFKAMNDAPREDDE